MAKSNQQDKKLKIVRDSFSDDDDRLESVDITFNFCNPICSKSLKWIADNLDGVELRCLDADGIMRVCTLNGKPARGSAEVDKGERTRWAISKVKEISRLNKVIDEATQVIRRSIPVIKCPFRNNCKALQEYGCGNGVACCIRLRQHLTARAEER